MNYELIHPDAVLTRYMPFVKFISILEQGLFIPNANMFDDSWEASLHFFNGVKNSFDTPEEVHCIKSWLYVSCWYVDDKESHAMWGSYGGSNESVAIQTTNTELRRAYSGAKKSMHCYLDRVRYKEPKTSNELYSNEPVAVLFPNDEASYDPSVRHAALNIFIKHIGYKFEKEARLVAIDNNASKEAKNNEIGFNIPFTSTRKMISKVLLHPNASSWFEKMVVSLIKDTYGLDIPIERSELQGLI